MAVSQSRTAQSTPSHAIVSKVETDTFMIHIVTLEVQHHKRLYKVTNFMPTCFWVVKDVQSGRIRILFVGPRGAAMRKVGD